MTTPTFDTDWRDPTTATLTGTASAIEFADDNVSW
jgi:hypothetical protein